MACCQTFKKEISDKLLVIKLLIGEEGFLSSSL